LRRSATEIVFVIDEDAGPHVADGVRDAGGNACLLTDKVPRGTPDVEWIPRAREWGSAIITRDIAMRRNPAEQQALASCGLHVFILRGNGLRLDRLRELTKEHYHAMLRYVRTRATPFLAHVSRAGLNIRVGGERSSAIKRQ
jgi:hypothetical protein